MRLKKHLLIKQKNPVDINFLSCQQDYSWIIFLTDVSNSGVSTKSFVMVHKEKYIAPLTCVHVISN